MSGRRTPSTRTVALAAAAATVGARTLLVGRPPGGRARWARTNFAGRDVDLLGGPATAAGALAGAIPLAVVGQPAPLVVTVGAASLGLYDDLAGETHARGLRGHLRALRQGRFTTGLAKMVGLFATGFAAGRLDTFDRDHGILSPCLDAALVSGTANLVNLLDLRPGRALKAVAMTTIPMLATDADDAVAAVALAVACCQLPDDLGERRMLGDCGANTLGALVGWSLARRNGRTRDVALATVVLLTLVSERVSFSAVIARNPVLRRIDAWGRRVP